MSVTVLVALLIGMLLYQFSQRTSQTQFKRDSAETSAGRTPQLADTKTLMPAILEQLSQLSAPPPAAGARGG